MLESQSSDTIVKRLHLNVKTYSGESIANSGKSALRLGLLLGRLLLVLIFSGVFSYWVQKYFKCITGEYDMFSVCGFSIAALPACLPL